MLSELCCVTGTVTAVTGEEPLDAAYVIASFEQAGRTLWAYKHHGYTTHLRSGGLEFVRAAIESYGWEDEPIRPPVPSAAAIDRMDRVMLWLGLIPPERYVLRRVVGLRSLVNPINDRHKYSWRALGRALGANHEAVKTWHAWGIDLIVAGLAREK